MNPYLRQAILFVSYVLVQVLVLQNLVIADMAVAHLFLLFLLFLPLQYPKPVLYITAFTMGLLIDILTQQVSASMMACLAVVAMRDWWIASITPQFVMGGRDELLLARQGLGWHLSYVLPLVAVYALLYNSIANLSLGWRTWASTITSTFYTTLLMMIVIVLFYRKEDRRR